MTIAQMLDLSRESIASAFPDEPEVEADVCQSVGWGYLNIARWEDAEHQWKRAVALRSQALGRDHSKTLESLADLALCYSVTGKHAERVEAVRWIRDSKVRSLGNEHSETLAAEYELAEALGGLGQLDVAERVVADALRASRRVLGETHPETLTARALHAGFRLYRGHAAESEALSRDLLADAENALGGEHSVTRAARSQLGAALVAQGKLRVAESIYGERPAPEEFGVMALFQGDFAPFSERTQVLVFWETWCPWSVRMVPELEEFYQRYKDRGVDVIGLTNVSRSATDEKVREFIAEKGVSFPIAKTDLRPWQYYDVEGTPWITVIQNGQMIWESYVDTPEKIPALMFEGLVKGM